MVRPAAVTVLPALACAVALLTLAARANAQPLLDFVTFDDVGRAPKGFAQLAQAW